MNKGMEVLTRKTSSLTEKTADLAEKSTTDNTVIKWITIVSLFYLPGSFVTVSGSSPPSLRLSLTTAEPVWNELLCIQSTDEEDRNCKRSLDLHCNLASADAPDTPSLWDCRSLGSAA